MEGGDDHQAMRFLFTVITVALVTLFLYVYYVVWWRPTKLRKELTRQGIRGPPRAFNFLSGNRLRIMKKNQVKVEQDGDRSNPSSISHNYNAHLFPLLEQWRKEYGPIFVCSSGNVVILYVRQPDLVREICLTSGSALGKPGHLKKVDKPLFGDGIIRSNGPFWAYQRKIVAPLFFMDKVKGMVDIVVQSTIPTMESWRVQIEKGDGVANIKVDEDLRNLSSDIISKVCFGSSCTKGKEIFARLRMLQDVIAQQASITGIPCPRWLPVGKDKINTWRIEREITSIIIKLAKERRDQKQSSSNHSTEVFLDAMLEEAIHGHMKGTVGEKMLVDNCKNVFFAGYETGAVSTIWTLMLLALNPKWQDQARSEVVDVCGSRPPDSHSISHMKILTMVIHESLRLYPPSAFVAREVLQDIHLGGFHLPRGVNLWIPMPALHHDPEIWGSNAGEFDPGRFANGVAGACRHPHVYMPFGVGSRKCVGHNLAMVEMKVILALILSKFAVSLSPDYRHSPSIRMVLEPKHGMKLLLKRVS